MTAIKNTTIFSLIFGAVCGLLSIIPVLGVIIFLVVLFCSSFIILVFMKKTGFLICPDEKSGLIYGALSGFVTFLGFSLTFLPSAFVLSLVFKESYFTGIGMILKSGFMLAVMMILFISILSAMMNAFSGLASIYVFNASQSTEKFTLDIDDKQKRTK